MQIVEYEQLVAKVDAKFDEIACRHPLAVTCRMGCSACCQHGISVAKVEQQSIHRFLQSNPQLLDQLAANGAVRGGEHCFFLSADGTCFIYPVRPVLCRSHGAPLYSGGGDGVMGRNTCALNFGGVDLAALDAADHINTDLLNTLLALINKKYFSEKARDRYCLDWEGIVRGVPSFTI